MNPGTYVDRNGDNVRVTRTASGLLLRWTDGRVAVVSA